MLRDDLRWQLRRLQRTAQPARLRQSPSGKQDSVKDKHTQD